MVSDVGPRLKSYLSFFQVDEGVYFVAGQRNFLLKGRAIFPLVSKMVRLLDGQRSLASIEAAFPPKARPLFRTLTTELVRLRMLDEPAVVRSPDLRPDESDLYRQTLRWLRDMTADVGAAFSTLRSGSIAVAGSGAAFEALVRQLMAVGLGELLVTLDECDDVSLRDAITRALEGHATSDPLFSYRLVDRRGLVDLATDASHRMVYVSDSVSDVAANPWLCSLIARNRPGDLIAGVFRGRGIIGPELGGSVRLMDVWDGVKPAEVAPLGPSTCTIVGHVVAHEVVRATLRGAGIAANAEGDLRHSVKVVGSWGEIAAHSLRGRAPSATSVATPPSTFDGKAHLEERRAWEAVLGPWLDPVLGHMAWVDDEPGLPLPHRSILLHAPGRTEARVRIGAWGLTLQEASVNVLRQAVAFHVGAPSAQDDASLVARLDCASWRRAALAEAIARAPLFDQHGTTAVFSPSECPAPEIRMLSRLARLYSFEPPTVLVRYVSGLPSFAATTTLGTTAAYAVAETALCAIVESFGAVISKLQRSERPAQDGALFPMDRVAARAAEPATAKLSGADDVDADAARLGAFGYRARDELVSEYLPGADGIGFHIGRVVMEPIE